jgi:hypothetical protein
MIILTLTLAAIAIFGAIVWDVKRRKNTLHDANSIEKPTDKSLRVFCIVCMLLLAFLTVLWFIYPPEPPFGAKGLPLHVAYLLAGKYGPSLLTFFVGLGFLVFSEKLRRSTQKNR